MMGKWFFSLFLLVVVPACLHAVHTQVFCGVLCKEKLGAETEPEIVVGRV